MKPARRTRSGYQSTASSTSDSAAVAAIPASAATTMGWCSGPLTPNATKAPKAMKSP